MQIIFPGEQIKLDNRNIGPGLIQLNDLIISAKAGSVGEVKQTLYIDNSQKRYIPFVGEAVIGIITVKTADFYRVDIGGPFPAVLDCCAFEGASKRNRPTLTVGALVYGRITLANRDMEPEMECMAASGKAEGFGELLDGFMTSVSLLSCRRLLNADHPILSNFAQICSFEMVVGLNGRIWVLGDSVKATVAISRTLTKTDGATSKKLLDVIRKEMEIFAVK